MTNLKEPLSLRVARPVGWGIAAFWFSFVVLGVAAFSSPDVAAYINEHLSILRGVAFLMVVAMFGVWGTAINLVAGDSRMRPALRRRWIVALVLFNLIAGLFFVLWGYRRASGAK